MPKKKKKTYAEIEAELKSLKNVRRSEAYVVLGQTTLKYAGLVWISYYAYLSVAALAGQSTFASVIINILGSISVSVAFAWLVGIVGAAYGLLQRSLRKDVIERLSGRVKELEKEIDNRRTSSRLTIRGNTRPEDDL